MANIGLIAQNFDIFEGDGLDRFARTGCISPNQILRAGAQGVILGHSEVGDEPEIVNKKILSLFNQNIPLKRLIILVGETWDELQNNRQKPITKLMKEKCEIIFKDIPAEFINDIIIGYEPKWSVYGSGRDDVPPPKPEFISACLLEISNFICEKYMDKIKPFYIYGGSLTPDRAKQILMDKNIDGVILGSACNTVKKTLDIANTMSNVCLGRKKVIICNFKAYELSDSYEDYINKLSELSDDFVIFLAPPYTDIYMVRKLLENNILTDIAKDTYFYTNWCL